MEYKRQLKRRWLLKTLIFLLFGMFTAKAKAQEGGLLPPIITVSPASATVQNGGTATFKIVTYCTLGVLSSVNWAFTNGPLPSNVLVSTLNGLLMLDSSITNTLTITNVSAASAGTYSVEYTDLLGILTSHTTQQILVSVLPTVDVIASGIVSKGFKIQFSAPTGSNIVIQASSNLQSWTSISTNTVVGGSVSYTDTTATASSSRFYRAKLK
jgi:hypothetical protein